jgi:hypothetical protein
MKTDKSIIADLPDKTEVTTHCSLSPVLELAEKLEASEGIERRGRNYVRNGSVLDLDVAPLAVTALVTGVSLCGVAIDIARLPKSCGQSVCRDCVGGIDSLVELLKGRFSKPVTECICRQDEGLFQRPSEIKFDCTCPDDASMCRHVAPSSTASAPGSTRTATRTRSAHASRCDRAALPVGPSGGMILESGGSWTRDGRRRSPPKMREQAPAKASLAKRWNGNRGLPWPLCDVHERGKKKTASAASSATCWISCNEWAAWS